MYVVLPAGRDSAASTALVRAVRRLSSRAVVSDGKEEIAIRDSNWILSLLSPLSSDCNSNLLVAVGFLVGLAMGDLVGLTEGPTVGFTEDTVADFEDVGLRVGLRVGLGSFEGGAFLTTVGFTDGETDGFVDATTVGFTDMSGAFFADGRLVGLLDGFAVGLLVFNGRAFFVNGDMEEAEDGCVAGSQELGSGFMQFGGVAGTHWLTGAPFIVPQL